MFPKNTVTTEFGLMSLKKEGCIFYYEKFIEFGSTKSILLTVESKDRKTSRQFDVFTLISANSEKLKQSAETFYKAEYRSELFKEWEIESIIIDDENGTEKAWSMELTMKGRWEHCVIEFNGLTPTSISFLG